MEEDKLLKVFGFNLKVERMKRGWTQAQFAEMLNVHEKHVCKIETGKQNITLKTLAKISNVLGSTESSLLDEK
ncbi:helix-turn-helix transcriptional regulator [bacterium]|nr:helix-turn-helix transcriptional regulator [bacterium]